MTLKSFYEKIFVKVDWKTRQKERVPISDSTKLIHAKHVIDHSSIVNNHTFIIDIEKYFPGVSPITIRQLLESCILERDRKEYRKCLHKFFNSLNFEGAPKGTRKKLREKIEQCRRDAWGKAEALVSVEKSHELKQQVKEKIRRTRQILGIFINIIIVFFA